MNPLIERLESLRIKGSDNLLLRFGLGKAYAEAGEYEQAIDHLKQALVFDPKHSSSWFWLGRTYYEQGQLDAAGTSLGQAVAVATEKGDVQTIKMAQVFLKRVSKAQAKGG